MNIPSIEQLTLLHNNICKALGDPKRIQILYALNERPFNVGELVDILDSTQSTTSRHLRVLHQRGLVITERNGTSVTYRLADDTIIDILDAMRQMLRNILERQASILA